MSVAARQLSRPESRRVRVRTRLGRVTDQAGDLLFLAPVLLVLTIVIVLPAGSAVAHSFTDWQPGYQSPWVGLDNYQELFESQAFRQVLLNHAFLLLGLPFWVMLPLALSFVLYEGAPYAGVFRALFFFPAVASPALIGILFAAILAPAGALNELLRNVGLGALAGDWLGDEHFVKPVLIAVIAWATMGMGVVIFSAALSAVPPELFESAELDGASWWQRLRYIVLPSIRRVVELWTVILIVTMFVGIFPWIYTLTRGGPGDSSTTFDWDIYQSALTYGYFGLAAAEAVVLLFVVALVVTVGVALGRRAGRA